VAVAVGEVVSVAVGEAVLLGSSVAVGETVSLGSSVGVSVTVSVGVGVDVSSANAAGADSSASGPMTAVAAAAAMARRSFMNDLEKSGVLRVAAREWGGWDPACGARLWPLVRMV